MLFLGRKAAVFYIEQDASPLTLNGSGHGDLDFEK